MSSPRSVRVFGASRSGPAERSRYRASLLACAALCLACAGPAAEPPSAAWPLEGEAQRVVGDLGMVVSGHPLASEVGARVLERGGNAVDAAVAVGFALAAVLPRAGNIGGGGFFVYRSVDGELRALDFRERAPAAAHRDMFLDERGEVTDRSVLGALAAGVPGSVAGLWEMHTELGTLPWSELVEPAVELARGHLIDAVRSRDIEGSADQLRLFPASARQFLPGGTAPAPGTRFEQPDLARTLERIAELGPDGFYRGPVADLLVAEMERTGGVITHQDLLDYRAVWRDPVLVSYRGNSVASMPPPSSGGITLGQMLNMLEGFETLPPFGSPELVSLEVEVMRRAFVDRNHFLGDPDFVAVPRERLLSKEYAARLRSSIEPGRPTPSGEVEPGRPESSETTHYSIVDAEGNAASVTTTLNFSFGGKVTVTGAGFLLNDEMDDFAAAPGRANEYGLVQGEANAIAPGKRMLSSMTPTIVTGPAGRVRLVLGSPGGPAIITTVLQVILSVLDHDMTLVEAVEAPRVHHQALPDVIFVEPDGLDPETVRTLRDWGYRLEERDGWSGNVSAIARGDDGWQGVADPRRAGGAAAPRHAEAREAVARRAAGAP